MAEARPTPRHPAELRVRGVRLVNENRANCSSDSAAYRSIAAKLGCSPSMLRSWCIQAERDAGVRPGRPDAACRTEIAYCLCNRNFTSVATSNRFCTLVTANA